MLLGNYFGVGSTELMLENEKKISSLPNCRTIPGISASMSLAFTALPMFGGAVRKVTTT